MLHLLGIGQLRDPDHQTQAIKDTEIRGAVNMKDLDQIVCGDAWSITYTYTMGHEINKDIPNKAMPFNTLRQRQDGHLFADDIIKHIFLEQKSMNFY